ncbi:MAG TPA: hypothetical protein VNL13_09690 [Sulfolobales archaeon]|nr:hypothetical protein [Sulfolobales archaeon]
MERSLYISTIMAILVLVAIIAIYMYQYGVTETGLGYGERGGKTSQALQESSWSTVCLKINSLEARLYNADTPSKWYEGYMFKNSTDFLNMGAVGMLFKLPLAPGDTITFTMRNVAFPLYLLHISPIEGVGDVAIEIIYMEPGKNYAVTVKTANDYFIELDPKFFTHIQRIGTGAGSIVIRVTGTC